MRYCTHCGQALHEDAAFCSNCGAAAQTNLPAAPAVCPRDTAAEDREFLELTHRLLRWERKAWSISSKFYIIMGSIYAGIFMLVFLIGLFNVNDGGGIAMAISIVYGSIFGAMILGLGIVSKKAGDKIPQYLDTVYTDFSLAYNRCGNVGMLVFTAILGTVPPIFFIINFVRMKSNRETIERIIRNQRAQ